MNVVVVIDGREAIPLRAVPYLSGWQGMTPDALATALLGHEVFVQFEGLLAYSKEGETIKAVRPRDWEDIVLAMKATDDRIKDREVSHSDGRDQARRECLRLLPAGWFVWKDEFEPMYLKKYGRVPYFSMSSGEQLEPEERKALVELDFDPLITNPEMRRLVIEGFESQGGGDCLAPAVTEVTSDTHQGVRMVAADEPNAKPWLVVNDDDPTPAQGWYTPARYFARQLVTKDSTLLTKKLVLADKVSKSLKAAGISKRGGKGPPAAETVLKAFVKVTLG